MMKRRSAEQIVGWIRQADMELRAGINAPEVRGLLGIRRAAALPQSSHRVTMVI